jgi:hypothetical protein
MGWTPLPDGSDLSIQPGDAYAVVASVSTSHSKADIVSQLTGRGLTIYSYTEGPVANGYRPVTLAATANKSGSVPWAPSFPASLVAHYRLQSAWVWVGVGSDRPEPPTETPETPSNPPRATASVVALGLGAVGALAWYIWGRTR